MSALLKLCPKCSKSPATIQCIDCQEKMCFTCEQKVHQKLKHKTDIIPYSQMKQMKSASQIICGIKETITPQLQQDLIELSEMADAKRQFIQSQEEKWSHQITTLEQSYQLKLKQFEKEIEKSEMEFETLNGNFSNLSVCEIKKQMEAQKKQAWLELKEKRDSLNEKEKILKEMIQSEQTCSAEIAKKEQLINQYKELLQQQQKEKELIKNENTKIRAQLDQIKQLFKTKLPELGLSADFIDRLNAYEEEGVEEEEEEEDDEENKEQK